MIENKTIFCIFKMYNVILFKVFVFIILILLLEWCAPITTLSNEIEEILSHKFTKLSHEESNQEVLAVSVNCSKTNGTEKSDRTRRENSETCWHQVWKETNCPPVKKGMLNVHLIPHTHLDVGWIGTVDGYYYGDSGVRQIIYSVIEELLKNPKRRFIFVETYYLWRWWQDSCTEDKNTLKKLVVSGRLEIIGGGWAMNDDAVTHYQPIIDQFTLGFRKLQKMFGDCVVPKIGWQIDPFGHSREMASIMSSLGFDAVFLGRIDYVIKKYYLRSKSMEFIWHGSPHNLGKDANIFTSVLYNLYAEPEFFCTHCKNTASSKIFEFIAYVAEVRDHYLSHNILIPMGGDFAYSDANVWYRAMDNLITLRAILYLLQSLKDFEIELCEDKSRSIRGFVIKENLSRGVQELNEKHDLNINIMYSTPSCYLKAVHGENMTFPDKIDDFLPYASGPGQQWTGYYTSRPSLKYFERRANNFLQVCMQLCSLTNLYSSKFERYIDSLRNGLGIMQHHDAVAGTERQHVADDYAAILSKGIKDCSIVTSQSIRKLINGKQQVYKMPVKLFICPLLNISECLISESSDEFVITIYNPLSLPATKFVRVPIHKNHLYYTVRSATGENVVCQYIPIFDSILKIPGRNSFATYELLFEALDIPPLGFTSFFISKGNATDEGICQRSKILDIKSTITFGNPNIFGFKANENGDITHVIKNGTEMNLTQNFYYYLPSTSIDSTFGLHHVRYYSGAYIFNPQSIYPELVQPMAGAKFLEGPLVQEVHKKYNDWISQVIRIYKDSGYIEFDWVVGPIPEKFQKNKYNFFEKVGKEVISRYSFPHLKTYCNFYTDSNGREMIKRKLNKQRCDSEALGGVSENYYPVTTRISIRDNYTQLSILTDRSQGGTYHPLHNQIELMIHRRLTMDDNFGVGEPLTESAFGEGLVVRGSHYLTVGDLKDQKSERLLAKQIYLQPWIFFTPMNKISFSEWSDNFIKSYSGLTAALPKNVHILTLEPWNRKTLLLRLEHLFERYEHKKLSRTVSVDLTKIFFPFTIKSIQEMTLGGNLKLKDLNRLKWNSKEQIKKSYKKSLITINSPEIQLIPMQIRTFLIGVKYNENVFKKEH